MSQLKTKLSNKLVRLFFTLLTAGSLIYVFFRMYKNWELIRNSIESKPVILALLAAGFIYFLLTTLLPKSWQLLLSSLADLEISYKDSYMIYGQTQIAKYLPGNVFHFVSRQMKTDRLGVSQGATLFSSLIETISYLLVAVIISLLFHLIGFNFQVEIINKLVLVFSLIILIAILMILVSPKLLKIMRGSSFYVKYFGSVKLQPGAIKKNLSKYFLVLFGFFILTSLLFSFFVYWFENGASQVSVFSLFPIFCLSYVVGLITPGAPAGFGVREAVMVVTLTPLIGGANAALLAVLFRMVTIVGDLLFFIAAMILQRGDKQCDISSKLT